MDGRSWCGGDLDAKRLFVWLGTNNVFPFREEASVAGAAAELQLHQAH